MLMCTTSSSMSSVDVETEWNLKYTELTVVFPPFGVDVETEWNLKEADIMRMGGWETVDVETEWNLKHKEHKILCGHASVDVETEWNLKFISSTCFPHFGQSRCRNRMEFKGCPMRSR